MHKKVLLLDDDDDLRGAIAQGLELAGHNVASFSNPEEALAAVSRQLEGCLISDIRMPGMDGMEVLGRALEIDPALPVILITGHSDVPLAVEAMKRGAYDFIEKPFATSKLVQVVAHGLEKRRLVLENRSLRDALTPSGGLENRLVGRTPQMQALRSQVSAVAGLGADVLVYGETGTGKDVIARLLHDLSERSKKPYVAINCGALPAEIIESELFGHEPGAFTGASKQRIGKIEYANGGTIFLDEIESMPLDLQVKLLRVIEERSIERLGSNKTIKLDLRFVAASKVDLGVAAEKGQFRADLFFRLNVVTLTIPALRARKDDIPLLFAHLAREARAKYRREIPDMTAQTMAQLMHYSWPGNVRELRNLADRFVMGLGLPESFDSETMPEELSSEGGLSEQVAGFEKLVLARAIAKAPNHKSVYESLGISRKTLYEKIKRYQLDTKWQDETEGNSQN